MALQLGVSREGGDPEFVTVSRWPFSIGRSTGCDLCLSRSKRVSRQHAEVMKQGDSYFVITHGRNPSYLNGHLLPRESPREIAEGDIIGIPDYSIWVHETAPATTGAVAAAPARSVSSGETANVQVALNSTVIERKIASLLGIQELPLNDGIYRWLSAQNGREVRIFHDRLELKLTTGLRHQDVVQRLRLFDTLMVDPHTVLIDIEDPRRQLA